MAEGVEDADQAEALRDLQCRLAQGYHFSRPVAPEAISALLDAEASAPGADAQVASPESDDVTL